MTHYPEPGYTIDEFTPRVLDKPPAAPATPRAEGRVGCAQEDCAASFPDHKWGHIRAYDDGWFEQKDGRSWCPEHNPDWVEGWRAQQGMAQPKPGSLELLATCVACREEIRRPLGEGEVWVHVFTKQVSCDG